MLKIIKTNSFKLTSFTYLALVFFACNSKKTEEQTPTPTVPVKTFSPQVLKDTIGGVYHEYYKNGNIKIKGSLKNGKRDGDWSYFYQNGKLWSWGEYTEGVRNGASSVYYENGVLKMEGNYLNNKQVGLWKFYNEKGKLVKEVNL